MGVVLVSAAVMLLAQATAASADTSSLNSLMSDISDVLYQQRGIKHLRLVLPSQEYLHTHLAELMDTELTSNTTFTLAYLNMTKGSNELSNLLLEQEPTCNVIFNPPNFDQLQQFLRKAWKKLRFSIDSYLIMDLEMGELAPFYTSNPFLELASRFHYFSYIKLKTQQNSDDSIFYEVKAQSLHFNHEDFRPFYQCNIWTPENGFLMDNMIFSELEDLKDFGGHVFKVCPMMETHPMSTHLQYLPNGTKTGTDVLTFEILSDHLNFGLSYVDNRDGMIFAAYIPANDSWLGIVGMLQREDADWAFPTISVNAQRLGYIDYIGLPYTHSTMAVTFIALPPGNIESWFVLIYPFERWVWISIAASFVVCSPIIYGMLNYFERKDFVLVLTWMVNILTGRGMKTQLYPRYVHSLFILISWGILATLVDFAYNSMLATSLMIEVRKKPLDTWDDVLKVGATISYAYGSMAHFVLENAKPDFAPMHHTVYQKSLKQDPDLTHVPLRISIMQAQFKKNPNMVFVMSERFPVPLGHSVASDGRQILRAGKERAFIHYPGVPFRKHFPYLKVINQYIPRLYQAGISIKLERLMVSRVGLKMLSDAKRTKKTDTVLELDVFRTPYVILAVGIISATTFFIYELFKSRAERKKEEEMQKI